MMAHRPSQRRIRASVLLPSSLTIAQGGGETCKGRQREGGAEVVRASRSRSPAAQHPPEAQTELRKPKPQPSGLKPQEELGLGVGSGTMIFNLLFSCPETKISFLGRKKKITYLTFKVKFLQLFFHLTESSSTSRHNVNMHWWGESLSSAHITELIFA